MDIFPELKPGPTFDSKHSRVFLRLFVDAHSCMNDYGSGYSYGVLMKDLFIGVSSVWKT